MLYLKEKVEARFTIKKSEFISILYPISSDEDIQVAIKDAKSRYTKATHYVTATIQGENGEYASSNDDGEPSRTAGFPALSVLMNHKVTNVLCVIIRYYGGIQLGGGGLIRAYSKSAVIALEKASFYKKVSAKKYVIEFDYHLTDTVDRLLDDKFEIVDKSFLATVTYTFIILKGEIDALNDIRHQLIKLDDLGEVTLNIDQ